MSEAHTGDQTAEGLDMAGMAHQNADRVVEVRIGMPLEESKEWQSGAEHCAAAVVFFSSIARWPC